MYSHHLLQIFVHQTYWQIFFYICKDKITFHLWIISSAQSQSIKNSLTDHCLYIIWMYNSQLTNLNKTWQLVLFPQLSQSRRPYFSIQLHQMIIVFILTHLGIMRGGGSDDLWLGWGCLHIWYVIAYINISQDSEEMK